MIFGILLKTGRNEVLPYLLPASSPTPFLVVEPPCVSLPRGGLPDKLGLWLLLQVTPDSRTGSSVLSSLVPDPVSNDCTATDPSRCSPRSHLSPCVPPDQRGRALGFALGPCTLSRVMSSNRPLQSFPAASRFAGFARRPRRRPWCSIPLDFLADSEKLYVCRSVPLACAREIGLVATLSGEAFTQVRDLLLLDLILLLLGVETAVVS